MESRNFEFFKCPRCGNTDERYFGYRPPYGDVYCRKCVSFIGSSAKRASSGPHEVDLLLHYPLTAEQKAISSKIIKNYKNNIDTLVYAVCGAGKTELSYGVIKYALEQGYQVGFALPRRDVVIELYWRLKEAFPKSKVTAVYGDHSYQLEGDIIILTTHQLYRYEHYFDLIVMDEIDAFPYKGSDVLEAMFNRARKGPCVLMSATPSDEVINEFKKENHDIVELRTRFHKKEIPVPQIHTDSDLFQLAFVIRKLIKYRKNGKKCLVFAPTINECEEVYSKVKSFIPKGSFVHSKCANREEVISDFKKGNLDYLITTSVLERGVTIKNLQVIVLNADNEKIYTSATLIQIAGRAGRKIDAPEGDVFFLAKKETKSMRKAIDEIRYCNTYL